MPRAIQPLLPPRPIQRATPQPKLETDRPESFEDALKSATTPKPAAKVPDKPKSETKATVKPESRSAATKTTKSTKAKTTKAHDDADIETLDASPDAEEAETANPRTTPQSTDTEDAAATGSAQKPKADAADDDHAVHHDPADPDAAPTDLAANAQVIQPVDRARDQQKQKQKPSDDPSTDDADTVPATTKPVVRPVGHHRPQQDGVKVPLTAASQPPAPAQAPAATPTDAATTPVESDANAPAAPAKPKAAATAFDQSIPASPVTPDDDTDASLPAADAAAADLPQAAASTEKPAPKKPADAPPTVSPLGLQQGAPLAPSNAPTAKPSPNAQAATNAASAVSDVTPTDDLPAPAKADDKSAADDFDLEFATHFAPDAPPAHTAGVADTVKPAQAPPPPPPEVEFAQANHDQIVTGVQAQLLPHGGTMQIRLDPPELGALTVQVEMRDGVMNATFQTSNENATQLLSHSLNQLKHVLEAQGVSVERLQVQQAPKNDPASHDARDNPQQQQQHQADDHAARQEQQRKELLRRMWRKVSGADDPIDYFA